MFSCSSFATSSTGLWLWCPSCGHGPALSHIFSADRSCKGKVCGCARSHLCHLPLSLEDSEKLCVLEVVPSCHCHRVNRHWEKVAWHERKGASLPQGGWLEYGATSFMVFLIHFLWPGMNNNINLMLWELYHDAQYKNKSVRKMDNPCFHPQTVVSHCQNHLSLSVAACYSHPNATLASMFVQVHNESAWWTDKDGNKKPFCVSV